MSPEEVTRGSFPGIIRDPESRRLLFAAINWEGANTRGGWLEFLSHVLEVAEQCDASPAELDELVNILLVHDPEDLVLSGLVGHPSMSHATLFQLLEAGRCIDDLGHLPGPEELLLRLAAEHRYEESILTLALYHYGPATASEERFLEFVKEYIDVEWLRSTIRSNPEALKLSGNKRQAALNLIAGYEAEKGEADDRA